MPKRQRTGAYKKSGVTINLGAAATKGKRKYKKSSKFPRATYGRQFIPTGTFLNEAGSSWRNANDAQRAWRSANNYYGTGAYGLKDIWRGAKGLVKQHGGKALAFLGGRMGGASGAAAGGAIGKAFGLGAYQMGGLGAYGDVQNNALVHGGSDDDMDIATLNPTMDDDSGDVIISHKEFIRNVVVKGTFGRQSTFDLQQFPINPGLQETFPFLSQMAQNFTMYSMEGLMFQYKPLSGEGGGDSNQLGKVIMSTDYDPQALPFINSVQMENYQYSQSTKPSLAMRHGVECKKSQGTTEMQYVRTGPSTRDKAWTDLGLFQVATEGIPLAGTTSQVINGETGTIIIGELWATYRIRLSRANLYSSLLGYNIRSFIKSYTLGSTVPINGVEWTLTPQVQPQVVSNLDVKIRAWRFNTNSLMRIVMEFPQNTILGVYKITVRLTRDECTGSGAESFGFWPTYKEPGDALSQYGVPAGEYLTQWGSAFLPNLKQNVHGFINPLYSNDPGIDLSNGQQNWAQQGTNTVVPASYSRTLEGSTGGPGDTVSTSVTYFAINAPGLNVPRLTLTTASFGYSALNVPLQVVDTMAAGTGAFTLDIAIEQVNAELSNPF